MSERYFKEKSTNQLYVKNSAEIAPAAAVLDTSLFEELEPPQGRQRYDSETGAWVEELYDAYGNPWT